METYKIVRHFFNGGSQGPNGGSYKRTILTGLSLEQAQAHCEDPETSSTTCAGATAQRRTRERGKWFDRYTAE